MEIVFHMHFYIIAYGSWQWYQGGQMLPQWDKSPPCHESSYTVLKNCWSVAFCCCRLVGLYVKSDHPYDCIRFDWDCTDLIHKLADETV